MLVFPVMFFGPTVRARPLPRPQHGRGLSDATRESSRGNPPPPPGPTPDNSSCLGPLTCCARGRIAEPITPYSK